MSKGYKENPFAKGNLHNPLALQKAREAREVQRIEQQQQQTFFEVRQSGNKIIFNITKAGAQELTKDSGHAVNLGNLINLLYRSKVIRTVTPESVRDFQTANEAYINKNGSFVHRYDANTLTAINFFIPDSSNPSLAKVSTKANSSIESIPTPVPTISPRIADKDTLSNKMPVQDAVLGQPSSVDYYSLTVKNVQENFWPYEAQLVLAAIILYTFRRGYGAWTSWKEKRERGEQAIAEALAAFEQRKAQREAQVAQLKQQQRDASTMTQTAEAVRNTAIEAMAERAREAGGVHKLSGEEKAYLQTLIGQEKLGKVERVSKLASAVKKVDRLKKKKGGMGDYLGAIDSVNRVLDSIATKLRAKHKAAVQERNDSAYATAGSELGDALGLHPTEKTREIIKYLEKKSSPTSPQQSTENLGGKTKEESQSSTTEGEFEKMVNTIGGK